MSLEMIGSKHFVGDVYPLRNKKVFVLVDAQNILSDTLDFSATLMTVAYLLRKGASVILASSFGTLTGIMLNLSRKEREVALDAFSRENGMGYTHFFSALSPTLKLSVLRAVPGLTLSNELSSVPNTGKTTLFASLSNAQKVAVLQSFFPKAEFAPATTSGFVPALQARFANVTIRFAKDCLRAPLHQLQPGEILVLENLRFYRNECAESVEERLAMAEVLAAGIDLYINDSFATTHLTMASNVELPRLMQHGAAGYSMDRELAFYAKFMLQSAKPLVVAMGGTCTTKKLRLIHSLVGKVDRLIIGGALSAVFLAAKGLACGANYPTIGTSDEPTLLPYDTATSDGLTFAANGNEMGREGTGKAEMIGRGSISEAQQQQQQQQSLLGSSRRISAVTWTNYARDILALCEQHHVEVILPIDHVVLADPTAERKRAKVINTAAVPKHLYMMDCGPNTIHLFARYLRGCRTIFWSGPLGCVEAGYTAGTSAFATMLGNAHVISIVGGRNTARVVHEAGLAEKILHVSSGGLACLELLQGNVLPGVVALSDVVTSAAAAAGATTSDMQTSISVNELLPHLPLFHGCNTHQMKVAARKFIRRTHARGDYLVCAGERHVRLVVVAQGGLVARVGNADNSNSNSGGASPVRYIPPGQAIGMYEFVTQAAAHETVRAAQDDTVTYQLSYSALNELLNAHPDLAAQLFQNITAPLCVIAAQDYEKQHSVAQVTARGLCRSRVPQLDALPNVRAWWEDLLQDFIATLVLQGLAMRYLPYIPRLDLTTGPRRAAAAAAIATTTASASATTISTTRGAALMAHVRRLFMHHQTLPLALAGSVVRSVVYHTVLGQCSMPIKPYAATLLSAVAAAPLRVCSYGVPVHRMNFRLILDETLRSALLSMAPALSYAGTYVAQQRVGRWYQGKLASRAVRLVLTMLVRLLLGVLCFPVIYQRNFLRDTPAQSLSWDWYAFRAYEARQVAAVVLRDLVHRLLQVLASV